MSADTKTAEELGFALGFLKVIVRDLEKSRTFYEQAFGFKSVRVIELADAVEDILVAPNGRFNLILFKYNDDREIEVGSAYGPLGLMTTDVQAAYDRAIAHGCVSVTPPTKAGPMTYSFVDTPDGHRLELLKTS